MGLGASFSADIPFAGYSSNKSRTSKLKKILWGLGILSMSLGSVPSLNRTINGMVRKDQFERSTHYYKDPIHPQDYASKNPQSSFHRDIDTVRAQFNKTMDFNLLNRFLPYRQALTNRIEQTCNPLDIKRLQHHDAEIIRFVHSPQVQFYFVNKSGQLTNLDKSTRYLYAAQILDFYHNRPDLISQVMNQEKPFRILFFETLKQTIFFKTGEWGGYYIIGNGDLEVDNSTFWESIRVKDGVHLTIHEYAHAIDASQRLFGFNIPNGILPGLSQADQKIFKEEHDQLLKFLKESKKNGKQPNWLKSYGFKNHWEFLPSMLELFYECPKEFQNISPRLYDVFRRYFRLDPANQYQDFPSQPLDIESAQKRP